MSIIMYMGSITLDWNLSKSAKIIFWRPFHIKTKFQNKTKTKPHNIFAILCRHFSLAKICQARHIAQKMFYE